MDAKTYWSLAMVTFPKVQATSFHIKFILWVKNPTERDCGHLEIQPGLIYVQNGKIILEKNKTSKREKNMYSQTCKHLIFGVSELIAYLISGIYNLENQILSRGEECFLFLISHFSTANNLKYPSLLDKNLWKV